MSRFAHFGPQGRKPDRAPAAMRPSGRVSEEAKGADAPAGV
ncbi:hypothetical protein [Erythrobacter sp. BLCC-B19]|nr:hypothetical protein [Erythrobacter sp. BLCC-B19]WDA41177.1 hypothetical protein PS060_16760 [Erythrobacter sp. BLCC-B19]